jgi:hypothetical protein
MTTTPSQRPNLIASQMTANFLIADLMRKIRNSPDEAAPALSKSADVGMQSAAASAWWSGRLGVLADDQRASPGVVVAGRTRAETTAD